MRENAVSWVELQTGDELCAALSIHRFSSSQVAKDINLVQNKTQM
jgi:hypothetical protein